MATHEFRFALADDDVIGKMQVTKVTARTPPDIARRFNVGYEEIIRANPASTMAAGRRSRVVVPTQFVCRTRRAKAW